MMGRRGRRAGFSLLEVMLCVGLLTVGLLATLAASLGTTQVQQTSRAGRKATNLVSDVMELCRSVGSADLQARLAQPLGAVADLTCAGTLAEFTITGAVDSTGNALTTELVDAQVTVTILTEQETHDAMPVDLTGDGVPDVPNLDGQSPADPAVSNLADYTVMPVRVSVTYRSGMVNADGTPHTVTVLAHTVIYPSSTQ